jgi:23S rRNA (adenine2030-N6)-methyltransferase
MFGKHLPLLEILKLEPPREYWETHSGAALYPLTHSPDRDYGIYWFLDHSNVEPILGQSRYRELLMTAFDDPFPSHYPGSAELAMRQVGAEAARYVLCETDRYSADSLREAAARNTLTDRVTVLEADGMDAVLERADGHPRPESVLVHIDPFDPYQPSPKNQVHAVELTRRLASRGFRIFTGMASMSRRSPVGPSARSVKI